MAFIHYITFLQNWPPYQLLWNIHYYMANSTCISKLTNMFMNLILSRIKQQGFGVGCIPFN